jgi:IS605 OrfB family transposase
MGVRSFQSRIVCDTATLAHLWRTHQVFNERLPAILSVLFKMRRGECGRNVKEHDLYQRIGRFIVASDSKSAEYLLNRVSIRGKSAESAKKLRARIPGPDGSVQIVGGDTWVDDATALSAKGVLLYDKHAVLGDLPGHLQQMVCRESVAIISGHEELVARWNKEHQEWLVAKAKWKADEEHQKYLALRPRFEAFEKQAGGKAGKRRGRWHLYLAWLKANPELARWRGGSSGVAELSNAARDRIRRAKPWKKRSVEAEEFWKVNPELQVLDKLHGYHEREFIRRRKTKKNADGFHHRPTFTLPHFVRHPRWFVFNRPGTSPEGYASLVLPAEPDAKGTVKLLLLTGDKTNGEYPSEWIPVEFRADSRLSLFRNVKKQRTVNRGKDKGTPKEADAYEFHDLHLGRWRKAEISGVKLLFRLKPDGFPKAAYLYFTCSIADEPVSPKAQAIKWSETGEITKMGKKRKRKTLPDGLVACAVDLGIRNLGFTTLAAHDKGQVLIRRSRNLWIGWQDGAAGNDAGWQEGPNLTHIAVHKRKMRFLRRKRGKPVKGEATHVELQTHIDHMGQDRFKRAARAIINFALNVEGACDKKTGEVYPRADVLILENMDGLIPDAEKEHGINRALVAWNRGQLTKRIEEMAKDVGLKVLFVSPMGTSQVCSKCGSLGRRYSLHYDSAAGRKDIRFGFVEKLFACPSCEYMANADHNASVNLHRRFVLDTEAVAAYEEYRRLTKEAQREALDKIENMLAPKLRTKHHLDGAVPF